MESSIPVIDLEPWWDGSPADRDAVAASVDAANREIGFLVISGHRVPDALVAEMADVTMRFFDQPEDEKLRSSPADPTWSRGYMPLRSRALAYSKGDSTPPDLVEFFAAGKPDVDFTDPYYGSERAGVHYHENIWPSAPPDMRDVWTRYYGTVEALGTELMRVFALALGLPAEWFDASVDRHCSNLFANNYPAYDGVIEPGQLRLGAHTDYGSLTILHQDGTPGGLQVHSHGQWLDAPVLGGAFVVNIGDLMARWTNDRWVSTLHRVVNPDAGQRGTRRISIPYFHQPNYDALIECIPTCLAPGDAPRYAPILSGVNMTEKTNKTLLT